MDPGEQHAEQICSVLNLCFGWRGAHAQWSRDGGYSGLVVLSPPAVQEVVDLHSRVEELEMRIIELDPRTRAVAYNGNGDVQALRSL
jgi:hypothetical protein